MDLTTQTPAQIDKLLVETQQQIQRALRGRETALRVQDRAALDAIEAKVAPLVAVTKEIDAEFNRRGRWTRFSVVSGCHVHAGFHRCGTFKLFTRAAPLPELSGAPVVELVAKYGTQLCAVCFPTVGELPEFKAAAAAEKARREAAEAARCPGSRKWIGFPNGRARSSRGTCPDCGRNVALVRGSVRAHEALVKGPTS